VANFRQIHTKIWKDPWFIDLPPERKLLFIYLFSNEQANMMGLYQLPLKVICFETDLDSAAVEEGLAQFAADGKCYFEDNYVWIVNLFRYNANNPKSPKTQTHILKTLDEMPDIPLKARMVQHYSDIIPTGYPLDTPSIPVPQEQEQEQDQQQEQEKEQEQNTAATGTDSAAAVADVLQEVHDLGITDPKATSLVTAYSKWCQLPELVPRLEGWIAHYTDGRAVKNPIGLAINQTERRCAAPASVDADDDRRRYVEGKYADIIEH